MSEQYSLELLKSLSEAHGVSGFEEDVRTLFARELAECGELSSDRNGSIFCSSGEGPVVMMAGHMDEVGFMVQNVTPDGFVQFVPIGGWWPHTLLSQRVSIRTREGRFIPGVIGSKPPHFLGEAQRNAVLPVDSMFIDVGAESRDQAIHGFGIHLGDPVAPEVRFMATENPHRYVGKAFDNRAGMAAVIEAMKILSREGHPNRLVAAGTVQEEVGTRGAKTAGAAVRPDCVLVLEAPPADDTPGFALSESQGRLGGGVQIRLFDPTAIMNPRLAALAERVAEESEIPFQLTVRRSGGTDAGAFHVYGEGVPCVVLGMPTRYIHAHQGLMDVRDYRAMVDLTVALARALDRETVDALTRYL